MFDTVDSAVCNAANNPCVNGECKPLATDGKYVASCQPCNTGWTGDKCDQSKYEIFHNVSMKPSKILDGMSCKP